VPESPSDYPRTPATSRYLLSCGLAKMAAPGMPRQRQGNSTGNFRGRRAGVETAYGSR